MKCKPVERVPGLFLANDYFSPEESSRAIAESLDLYERLEQALPDNSLENASIPQPAYVRSEEHNLQGEEHFARVTLEEGSGRVIRSEYFPRYGEDGHALAYFQRNRNLPDFVSETLLGGISTTIEQIGLVEDAAGLNWKLTMNFYCAVNEVVSGFPFHVDIPTNGVVTMILNIHREACFQIAKDENTHDLTLPVGSLLILSGESRYEWKHRVLPSTMKPEANSDLVQRVSLVLGYQ